MAQEDPIRQQELEPKRRDWNTHITSWQASWLSQAEYCRRHELKFHQFVYWRRKFAPKSCSSHFSGSGARGGGGAGSRLRLNAAGPASGTGPGSLH